MYNVYCLKLSKREPIINDKTSEVIDNGENKNILLTQEKDRKTAEFFIEHVKQNVKKRQWKFWIEEIKI